MTREQRDELRRLEAAATGGPWFIGDGWRWRQFGFGSDDAALVVALRNNVVAMLDDLDAKDAELADARQDRNAEIGCQALQALAQREAVRVCLARAREYVAALEAVEG